jgi:Na+/H+ antiporter NhaA
MSHHRSSLRQLLLGFLAGKPLGMFGMALAVSRLSRGRPRPPVGWAAVISAGTITGAGFTVEASSSAVIDRSSRTGSPQVEVTYASPA